MTTDESSTVEPRDVIRFDVAERLAVWSGFFLFISPLLTGDAVSAELVVGGVFVLFGIAGCVRLANVRRSRDTAE